jgi:hypothetical protein
MENDLESQIRELIDRGARPVSLHEVSQRSATSAPRAAGRRRLRYKRWVDGPRYYDVWSGQCPGCGTIWLRVQ